MSREGRSQPIQPFATHGFLGNTPANGTLPGRIIVSENDDRRRRTPPLQPLIISGALKAVTGAVATITPPLPIAVSLVVQPRLVLQPIVSHGPVPVGAIQAITPAGINATSSMSATVSRFVAIAGTLTATSTVTASVARTVAIRPGAVNTSSAVTATVSKLAALRPSINSSSTIIATVSTLHRLIAAVTATSTVAFSGSILPVSPFLLHPHTGTDRIYNLEQWLTVNGHGFVPFGRTGLDRIQTIEAWLTGNPVAGSTFVPFGLTGTDRMWTIESYLLAATGSTG